MNRPIRIDETGRFREVAAKAGGRVSHRLALTTPRLGSFWVGATFSSPLSPAYTAFSSCRRSRGSSCKHICLGCPTLSAYLPNIPRPLELLQYYLERTERSPDASLL